MSDTDAPAAKAEICRRHAVLVAATREAIDALPMPAPDSGPHSLAALKAEYAGDDR